MAHLFASAALQTITDPAAVWEWIERLGGWAFVVVIVKWMMRRLDRGQDQTDQMIRTLERTVEWIEQYEREGRTHQSEQRAEHARILSRLEALSRPA